MKNENNEKRLYESPEVKVVEINARQVVCAASVQGEIESMGNTDETW